MTTPYYFSPHNIYPGIKNNESKDKETRAKIRNVGLYVNESKVKKET